MDDPGWDVEGHWDEEYEDPENRTCDLREYYDYNSECGVAACRHCFPPTEQAVPPTEQAVPQQTRGFDSTKAERCDISRFGPPTEMRAEFHENTLVITAGTSDCATILDELSVHVMEYNCAYPIMPDITRFINLTVLSIHLWGGDHLPEFTEMSIVELYLDNCHHIPALPYSLSEMKSLRKLVIIDCVNISLPYNIGSSSIRILMIDTNYNPLLMPASICTLVLDILSLRYCRSLKYLPIATEISVHDCGYIEQIHGMEILSLEYQCIPDITAQSLKKLILCDMDSIIPYCANLTYLKLDRCPYITNLNIVPITLRDVYLHYCDQLECIRGLAKCDLANLCIRGCPGIREYPVDLAARGIFPHACHQTIPFRKVKVAVESARTRVWTEQSHRHVLPSVHTEIFTTLLCVGRAFHTHAFPRIPPEIMTRIFEFWDPYRDLHYCCHTHTPGGYCAI